MCLTRPVQVIAVEGPSAVVAAGDVRRRASILAVPEVQPGDWAILAGGILVRVLDTQTAQQMVAAIELATDSQGSELEATDASAS